MEVIPTDDGGDDGVIWLRCPECQGFLPKFSGEGYEPDAPAKDAPSAETPEVAGRATEPEPEPTPSPPPVAEPETTAIVDEEPEPVVGGRRKKDAEPEPEPEPVAEYAALLAELDPELARPYRPTQSYEVGTLIHHLAYDDFGVVVDKEDLPGGRKVLKTFFESVGVVRLIEQDSGKR